MFLRILNIEIAFSTPFAGQCSRLLPTRLGSNRKSDLDYLED